MKTKKLSKKLGLNKKTIAVLNGNEMRFIDEERGNRAADNIGDGIIFLFDINRLKRFMMGFEVLLKNYLEVLRRFLFGEDFSFTGFSLRGSVGST